jgi:hypothetical protein
MTLRHSVSFDDLGADLDLLERIVARELGDLAGGDLPCITRTLPKLRPSVALAISPDLFS